MLPAARLVPQLSTGWRYLISPAATGLAFLIQFWLLPTGSIAPFVFFFVSVALSALLGGLVPGVLAVVLSAAVSNYVFMGEPGWSTSGPELTAMALFLVASFGVALLCAALRDVATRAQQIASDLQRQASVLALSHDALLVWRPDTGIEDWNLGAEEMYGFAWDEACGQSPSELLQTKFPRAWSEIAAQLEERGRWDGELVHTTRDGRTLTVAARLQRVPGDDGLERILQSDRDITDRKQADEALRESELRYRTVGETIPYGVWAADAAGHCTYVSQSFLEMVGMTLAEVQEFGWLHLLPPEDLEPTQAHWLQCVRTGEDYEAEHRFQTRDGSARFVLAIGRPVREGGAGTIKSWVGINLDVTDRKRAQEAVRKANERLLDNDRRKNEFLAVLSHELRNPLAPIRNSIHILERAAPGAEQAIRALKVIDRQVAQLARLIDDLLDITRVSSGKIRLQRESLSLNELVRCVGEDFRGLLRLRGIDFQVELTKQPLWAFVDPARMAQVIGNLLQNAAKFTPSGGKIRLSLERDDGGALISVRDDGAGIEAGLLERLFEPFVQGDATLDRSQGGLGLGLALARGLVELHQGTISVHSQGPGTGCLFTVRLALEKAEATAAQLSPAQPDGGAKRVLRVLLIEDNLDAAASLKEALELNGHEVETAATGPEGIEKARALHPEVVLCDIGLPGIDGLEVARRMRRDPVLRGACLIALSGYAAPEDVERSKEAGFVRHLAKPPDLRALETTMLEGCGPGA